MIFFTVRSSLSGLGQFTHSAIKNFELKDSSSQSLVGGVPIESMFNQTVHGKYWVIGEFLVESYLGVNNNYTYMYSFSSDPQTTLKNGQFLNSYNFKGQETLTITFNAALGSAVQLDCYAYVDSFIKQSPLSITVGGVDASFA
jgi:hypothetical protein